ncbi:MAG: peptide-methionine (S)-S-oxide reductase MsrA, partial [Chitinophagaceae bacterium]|nr:peptide-methionine (S)-S-oxide reductase MsrA [Chitinophagaceae bacterium]
MSINACIGQNQNKSTQNLKINMNQQSTKQNQDSIVLGGGCFWCVEAQLKMLKGVDTVVSGYAGGSTQNPTYKEVCTGLTGHAEVIKVVFNQNQINIEKILEAFWQAHDPTQINRQGNDIGTQYRSVIFYQNENQKEIAEKLKEKLIAAKVYESEVVTAIEPLDTFYPAEDYHQNYYEGNTEQPYCRFVITPKIEKFKKI